VSVLRTIFLKGGCLINKDFTAGEPEQTLNWMKYRQWLALTKTSVSYIL